MKTEIQTKLEIAQILIKHLGDIDVSNALTPLQEYFKKQCNIGGVGSTCCEETKIVNQFLQRPYKYCKSCSTELK